MACIFEKNLASDASTLSELCNSHVLLTDIIDKKTKKLMLIKVSERLNPDKLNDLLESGEVVQLDPSKSKLTTNHSIHNTDTITHLSPKKNPCIFPFKKILLLLIISAEQELLDSLCKKLPERFSRERVPGRDQIIAEQVQCFQCFPVLASSCLINIKRFECVCVCVSDCHYTRVREKEGGFCPLSFFNLHI